MKNAYLKNDLIYNKKIIIYVTSCLFSLHDKADHIEMTLENTTATKSMARRLRDYSQSETFYRLFI